MKFEKDRSRNVSFQNMFHDQPKMKYGLAKYLGDIYTVLRRFLNKP